jgi:hypothetical protein
MLDLALTANFKSARDVRHMAKSSVVKHAYRNNT